MRTAKKAFSLLEILFVIAIIGIIITIAIPKYKNSIKKTDIIRIQSDLINIRDSLNNLKTKNILNPNNKNIDNFNDIIDTKIWSRLSDTQYSINIENNQVIFYLDTANYTFNCSLNDQLCVEYFN
jgi:general secretion pathway protein G